MVAKRHSDAPIQVCALHEHFADGVKTTNTKLDTILANQGTYIQEQQRLKDIVENGLKTAVVETRDKVEKINGRISTIEQHFESFTWFRTWITAVRDNLFKKTLQLAMAAAVVWFILTFGKEMIIKMIR